MKSSTLSKSFFHISEYAMHVTNILPHYFEENISARVWFSLLQIRTRFRNCNITRYTYGINPHKIVKVYELNCKKADAKTVSTLLKSAIVWNPLRAFLVGINTVFVSVFLHFMDFSMDLWWTHQVCIFIFHHFQQTLQTVIFSWSDHRINDRLMRSRRVKRWILSSFPLIHWSLTRA